MKIKKFEAEDMQEALRLIKNDLGPEAVILSTKKIRRGDGMLGFFGSNKIEVAAAIDYDIPKNPLPKKPLFQKHDSLQSLKEDLSGIKSGIQSLRDLFSLQKPDNNKMLQETVGQLKEMVDYFKKEKRAKLPFLHENLIKLYQKMISSEIDEQVALKSVETMNEQIPLERIEIKGYCEAYLGELLSRLVKVSGPLLGHQAKRKVAVLIGPTGVGKTTTIAKLASQYSFREKAKVALVALDTFRVGAVEQLKVYSKILGIPMDVAGSVTEMKEILGKRRDADLILMDTAGRSQRDQLHMSELTEMFRQGLAFETFLVLSATTKEKDLKEIIQKFKGVPIDGLIFTKLDETTSYGNIYNTLLGTGLPLSYMSAGQKVPEDIDLATPKKVADLILKG